MQSFKENNLFNQKQFCTITLIWNWSPFWRPCDLSSRRNMAETTEAGPPSPLRWNWDRNDFLPSTSQLTSRWNRNKDVFSLPTLARFLLTNYLPLVCSSNCPPARCRGRRAAGPCTARTAACAAPTTPAGRLAPQRESSAWKKRKQKGRRECQSWGPPFGHKGCPRISDPRANLQVSLLISKRGSIASTFTRQPSHKKSPESWAARMFRLNTEGQPNSSQSRIHLLPPYHKWFQVTMLRKLLGRRKRASI